MGRPYSRCENSYGTYLFYMLFVCSIYICTLFTYHSNLLCVIVQGSPQGARLECHGFDKKTEAHCVNTRTKLRKQQLKREQEDTMELLRRIQSGSKKHKKRRARAHTSSVGPACHHALAPPTVLRGQWGSLLGSATWALGA